MMSQRILVWGWWVVLLSALAVTDARAETPEGQAIPLQLRPLTDVEMAFFEIPTAAYVDQRPPEELTAQPAYVDATPRFAHHQLPGPADDHILTMVLDRSAPEATLYDVLYMDRDNDNDLAEEAPLHMTRQNGFETYFEPVLLTFPVAGEVRKTLVRVRTFNLGPQGAPAAVLLHPAGCLEGSGRLDGKSCRVAVVDANLNGTYADAWERGRPGDLLLMDSNGDGQYDLKGSLPRFRSDEVRPFSPLWQIAGRWWDATVAQDGSALTLAPTDREMGQVNYRGPEVKMVLSSRHLGILTATLTEGVSNFPAEEYSLQSARLTAKDEHGRQWAVDVAPPESEAPVRVATDSPWELDFSTPLVATVVVASPQPEQVGFSLTLKTTAGQAVASVTAAGGLPPEPTFVVTDASGREVHSGKFEYG